MALLVLHLPDSSESISDVFQLSIPPHSIPGASKAKASVIGDVMGPTLKNLNNLLNLPFGCGEQNMANFAPNVYVLKYLSGTNQLTDEIKTQALYYLQTGKQMNSFR